MPIRSVAARGVAGTVEIFPEYEEGLRDVEGFSHLTLLYHLVRSLAPRFARSWTTSRAGSSPHTRPGARTPSASRPCGSSESKSDVDATDGTSLLDIKPYVSAFDDRAGARIGWFVGKTDRVHEVRADGRFR